MTDIFEYLSTRPYPGRGILLGKKPDGASVLAYFIMGRSANSRNRVFEKTTDGIRTRAFDESKMEDPSLIIYHPVRHFNNMTIVTNGDQTDTIRSVIASGALLYDALSSRCFEPDEPNWTPRISGILGSGGAYVLSILKSADGDPSSCERFYYDYKQPKKGEGHFISTYEGFGSPIPSFFGEPVRVAIPDISADEFAESLWESLDDDNKVSLYLEMDGSAILINKNKED